MDLNKKYFTDFLNGCGTKAVLFEPFISQYQTETLIWRRGEQLWNTPENYIDTLIALSERTRSDIIFADMRSMNEENSQRLLEQISKCRENVHERGFGIITDNDSDIKLIEDSGVVDVLCVYGDIFSSTLPTIRMDGSAENAIKLGYCGYYITDNAEEILEKYSDKIRILGGLGKINIESSSPVKIYSRVENIHSNYGNKWACGSGGQVSDEKYLELISLLGAFAHIR